MLERKRVEYINVHVLEWNGAEEKYESTQGVFKNT